MKECKMTESLLYSFVPKTITINDQGVKTKKGFWIFTEEESMPLSKIASIQLVRNGTISTLKIESTGGSNYISICGLSYEKAKSAKEVIENLLNK